MLSTHVFKTSVKLNSQSLAFTIIFQRPSSFVPYNNWRFFVDSTDFINFTEITEVPKHSIIVSIDMTSQLVSKSVS